MATEATDSTAVAAPAPSGDTVTDSPAAVMATPNGGPENGATNSSPAKEKVKPKDEEKEKEKSEKEEKKEREREKKDREKKAKEEKKEREKKEKEEKKEKAKKEKEERKEKEKKEKGKKEKEGDEEESKGKEKPKEATGTPRSKRPTKAESHATPSVPSREGMRRDRKKVERLSDVIDRQYQQAVDSRVVLPQGSGTRLKDCPRVLYFMYMSKPEDLKLLHTLVFGRAGKANEVRKNLLEFNGFEFDADSKEFDRLVERAGARKSKELKKSLYALDLERTPGSGQRDMAQRLCEFLVKPHDNGKKPPKKLSFQRMQEKRKGGKKGAKSSGSKKRGRKATGGAKSGSSDDDDSEEDGEGEDNLKVVMETDEEGGDSERLSSSSESEHDDSDDGKKKKKAAQVAKKTEKKKQPGSPKKKPAPASKRGRKRKASDSDSGSEASDEEVLKGAKKGKTAASAAAATSSDEDDMPLKKLKMGSPAKAKPPTDEEIKKAVCDVIAKADIDDLTVSSAIKQVYDKFLPLDISERKDFIKATIKQAMNN